MPEPHGDVVVAGHVCLDIIPMMTSHEQAADGLFMPGKLIEVGSALLSTGGAVSNTGVALHRLGMNVKLLGKVGDDLFGSTIRNILASQGAYLADRMIVAEGETSSYSIVLNPPGFDRMFLHCKGTNDTFTVQDIDFEELRGVKVFHYGYPPLMRNMYINDGEELMTMFERVKSMGVLTSLDMAMPDPASESGGVDWQTLLQKTLPHVDVFIPSLEEILYMLHKDQYDRIRTVVVGSSIVAAVDGYLLNSLSEQLLQMGAGVVVLKLGEHGLYLRSTSNKLRLESATMLPESRWLNRELFVPSYEVEVQGATGAGDCMIAGFITSLLHGLVPEEVLLHAAGTGACNVEKADATSGIISWEALESRITSGWEQRAVGLSLQGWYRHPSGSYWIGPSDQYYDQ